MAIQAGDIPRMPHAYLREGQTVRVTGGPLANVEGVFLNSDDVKGLLVLSVELLSRSVAVKVDCSQVVPV
jgi:transcription antitermination factor NusG